MTVEILGNNWKIKVLKASTMQRKHGSKISAVTLPETSVIEFCETNINIPLIRHELFHAYYAETSTNSASLTGEQTEEVAAELIAKYGEELVNKANEIYYNLGLK